MRISYAGHHHVALLLPSSRPFLHHQGLVTRFVLKGDKDAWAFSFYFSAVGALVSLPFVVMQPQFSSQASMWLVMLMVGVGLVGTGVFYLAYQYALKHGTAVTASLFTYLQPISGIGLAALILGESITWPFVIGGVLAVVGAQIASRPATAESG